jgi:hypothetical protein
MALRCLRGVDERMAAMFMNCLIALLHQNTHTHNISNCSSSNTLELSEVVARVLVLELL